MKISIPPPIPEKVISELRQFADSGATQEELIRRMRDANLGIIPSIKLLQSFRQLSLIDAKHAVHFSHIWSDCRESNDKLHEEFLRAIQELDGFETREAEVSRETSLRSA